MTDPRGLIEEVLNGDDYALARIITHLENRRKSHREIVRNLHPHTGQAHIVGVTGAPGTGKSTLVNALIPPFLDNDQTVGVVAMDPSSPFSGGSILGDRTRLQPDRHHPDVFFRSMSARGSAGGLSASTGDVVRALDAFGKDVIIVETVGAGQNEIEIMNLAHTVLLVLTPSGGDHIQLLKAGILEIGDIFVLNKADQKGTDRTVMDLEEMIQVNKTVTSPTNRDHSWTPPIVETVATQGRNVDELRDHIREHYQHLKRHGGLRSKEIQRYRWEIRCLLMNEFRQRAERMMESKGGIDSLAESIARRETDPYTVIERILNSD